MNTTLFLALVGTTIIVTRSTLFRPLQTFYPMFFACSMCVGFWVGVFAVLSGIVTPESPGLRGLFVVGTATSFLSLLSDAVLIKLLGDPNNQ